MNRFFLPSPNSQASMSSLSTHGRNPHFRFQTLLLFSSYYLYYFVLFLTSKSPMPQNVQTNSIFCFWTSCQCKHLTTDASRSPCHTHIHTPTAMSTLQGMARWEQAGVICLGPPRTLGDTLKGSLIYNRDFN
jgi:hypothetical protein